MPEGERGYISKTLSTTVLQHLFNIFNHSVVLVMIETLSVRYHAARLETVLEAEEKSWRQCYRKTQAIRNARFFA